MRYLLLAVWILLSAGAASAGWDEVMDVLEQASGPEYDIGVDPAAPEWVSTRKARLESERVRMRGANLRSKISRDQDTCRETILSGKALRCE
jgi:hypothetical protein